MLRRVRDDLITQAAPESASGNALLSLEARNLTFTANGRTLIDQISLLLHPGSKTVCLGPNGAGKSLLLRLLHGLIEPTAGEVLWNGQPSNAAIRAQQAFVFQRPVLLRRSAEANIGFTLRHLPRSQRTARIAELLEHAGLSQVAKTPARLLSGGEQQRLSLARAIANTPSVLFLDEPTASLDPASTKGVEDMIASAHDAGTKVIMVTHDIGQARRIADEIVFVHAGRIAEQSNAEKFFNQPKTEAARAYLEGRLLI